MEKLLFILNFLSFKYYIMNNKNINSDLLNIFAENGILQNSQNFPNYRPRIQQLQMANMIDIAIKNKKIIVI